MKKLEIQHSLNGKTFRACAELLDGTVRFATETTDVAIVEHVRGLPDQLRQSSLECALEVGVRLQTMQRAGDGVVALSDQMSAASRAVSDHLSAASSHMANQLRVLEAAYLDEKSGKLPQTISKIAREFRQQLDPDKGDALRKLRDVMISDLAKPARQLIEEVRELLDLNRGDSAVAVLNTRISEMGLSLAAMAAKLDAQTALSQAKRANPHVAGASLEDYFLSIARPIAQASGEELEDLRDVGGVDDRAKVGDFILRVDPALSNGGDASVVVEIKNRRDSVGKLAQELKCAKNNRSATVALGVLTNPKAASEPSCEIFGRDQVIVFLPGFSSGECELLMAEHMLRQGFKIARLLAIANTRPRESEGIDLSRLQDVCVQLNTISKRFSALAADHTRIRTAICNAENTAASVKGDLLQAIQDLGGALDAALHA